ncbi:DUF4190 domain-containing protein [Nocardioides sp. GCM10030258]|uniref:DUF4190 domain-containing protein n=1 Tax=unclassified Nocardioides TaxID=2615069 RepID=UPI003620C962
MSGFNPPPYEPPVGGPQGEYDAYSTGNPYAGNPAPTATDGVSIAALVCSLTCCAAPVGVGLGIAGLVRTSGGKRSGRWAAITGLVVGSLIMAGGLTFFVFAAIMGSKTVFPDEASVGQCIGWDLFDDPEKANCSEPHYGQISSVGRFSAEQADRFDEQSVGSFCASLAPDQRYLDAVDTGEFRFGIETDAFDDDEPEEDDAYFCYVERVDEEQFDGALPAAGSSTGA